MIDYPFINTFHYNTKENTMKPTHTILLGLVVASAALMAGSVTIPHSFTANTTAKASEVNENFSAVKTAVDGNANDIATNKSDISDNADDIATNKADITTNANNMITGVTATGGLTGGGSSGDVTVRRASGSVAISPAAFHPSTDPSKCFMKTNAFFTYFMDGGVTTDDNCRALAQVTLPDGATLEKLTCVVKDNDDATHPQIILIRNEPGNGAAHYLFTVNTTANSNDYQTIEDDTAAAGKATVDNAQYTYHLRYDPPNHTTAAGTNQKLYGCIIDYSY